MSAAPATSTAPGSMLLGAAGGRSGAPASGAAPDRAAAFDAALTTADRKLGAEAVDARDAGGADEDGTTAASCGDASEAGVSTHAGVLPACAEPRQGEGEGETPAVSSSPVSLANILIVPTGAPTLAVTVPASTTAPGGSPATETGAAEAAAETAARGTAVGPTPTAGTPEGDGVTPALLLAAREDRAAMSAAGALGTGAGATPESPSEASASRAMPDDAPPTAAGPGLPAFGAAPVETVSRQDLRNVTLPTAAGAAGTGIGAAAAPPSAPSPDVEVPVAVAPAFSSRSGFPARATAEPGVAAPPTTATASAASGAPVPLPGVASTASVAPAAAPASTPSAPQPLAAQIAPAVLHLAQRPAGSHQLTMTIEPESLGPVTVRAHISADGEVQVHLLGATDAGREALRTLLGDLRRDLAGISPHSSVALGAGPDTGGGADRGPTGDAEQAPRDHDRGRGALRSDTPAASAASAPERREPTPTRPTAGAGLDIFA